MVPTVAIALSRRNCSLPAGMILRIDTDAAVVEVDDADGSRAVPFSDPEAFDLVSKAWLRIGWEAKYSYQFTWLGRPIIQLPQDIVRLQETIFRVQPDVILETGIAHGGSLVLYASLCEAMGHGSVIGVDLEIRPHNRAAIEAHRLFPRITLIEGNSTDDDTFSRVVDSVGDARSVLVLLDSNHSKEHVLGELRLYSSLVTVGSYICVADGIMRDLVGAPQARPDWEWNNPLNAANEFLAEYDDFEREAPAPIFNEGVAEADVTYWPGGWLRRVR
jgi:cephalosporin hydroxylase